ncbi:aminotransferase-like domain-containing protein [Clostridium botulinum]|uniref:hypothetical protein n=1 Tax=Clostridium botulinum TaxID=1491 RepID=UPI001E627486|nr:hypothetical protein [Clostridium botulinum]MCC5438883.1 hypothetical protein [Clostridium botulinum]
MPGLRVAALILPDLLINGFLEHKKWIYVNSSILSQGALEICIKNGMFDTYMKQLVNLYAERMSPLKNTLLEYKHPRIKYNIPESGCFGRIYVNGSLRHDKILNSLHDKNIKIFNTAECFLKEYRCNNYFRITISEVNNKQIIKDVPIILDTIKKHLV